MTKTTAEMITVMQAFVDGKKIECFWSPSKVTDNWVSAPNPLWCWEHFDYRIAEEPRIPDTIDWSHVAEEFICCATGLDERSHLLGSYPNKRDGYWERPFASGNFANANAFASFKRGNLPWDQSLIYRPGYEPKEGGE